MVNCVCVRADRQWSGSHLIHQILSQPYLQLVFAAATRGIYRPHIGLLRIICQKEIENVVLMVFYN